jgi:hypothetical protein
MERRRDRRIAQALKLTVAWGRREFAALSEDVSFGGLALRTPAQPPERELVGLRMTLPSDGLDLHARGMVVRRLAPAPGGVAGLGVRLYALSGAERERWVGFVRSLGSSSPRAPLAALAGRTLPGERRRAVRLQLRFATVTELEALCVRDVSKGGLVVDTGLALPPGTPVRLSLLHPGSGEQFPLDAVVRWRATGPRPGVGLELTSLTGLRRAELVEFVRSELPVDDVVYGALALRLPA